MVLEWIVLAQPAAQAFVAQVFSAQGVATAAGFFWVVHQALFGPTPPVGTPAKTLDELKQGIRQRMQRRHAGG